MLSRWPLPLAIALLLAAPASAADEVVTAQSANQWSPDEVTIEVRHPVEVPGEQRDHLVQWLSKRVGYELRAPELEPINLKLVGGRLLPGPTSAAAFFMYEAPSGERFTLYCTRTGNTETALRYNAEGDLGAIFWADNNVAYVVAGPADRDRLQKIAKTAYDQIDQRTPVKTGALWLN